MNPALEVSLLETKSEQDEDVQNFLKNLKLIILVNGYEYEPEVYGGEHIPYKLTQYIEDVYKGEDVKTAG